MKLSNRIALVTGASRGIGKAICLALASEGADIVAVDIKAEWLEETKRAIEAGGRKCLALAADVSKHSEVKQAVDAALAQMGRVDILVNNAGITRDNLLLRMTEAEWDAVLSVNLKGAFNCTRAVVRAMVKQRYGRIINISSVIGLRGNAGQANYAASKAGLIGLTKASAQELASRQITVNAIAPGFIETQMTQKIPEESRKRLLELIPQKKLGQPEDVARLAVFLASDDASYITGEVIRVDGGMAM
ncbi:MAG: 3-oxoacyl-[acyl-carrier-protein] reductase [Verrucomicrobiota bacterium]|jgi:3-oxoacyl-[acyl-carrier protein] reductase